MDNTTKTLVQGVNPSVLKKLAEPMPVKWKPQRITARGATIVAYIDARQVQNRLDEVCGPHNWASENFEMRGNLYCKLGINILGQWIYKSDVGKESSYEKEKGEVSDALKRAAVQWGVGRFAYEYEMIYLQTKQNGTDRNNKPIYVPVSKKGELLNTPKKLNDYCNYIQGLIGGNSNGEDCTGMRMEYSNVARRLAKMLDSEEDLKKLHDYCKSLQDDIDFLDVLQYQAMSINGNNGK